MKQISRMRREITIGDPPNDVIQTVEHFYHWSVKSECQGKVIMDGQKSRRVECGFVNLTPEFRALTKHYGVSIVTAMTIGADRSSPLINSIVLIFSSRRGSTDK